MDLSERLNQDSKKNMIEFSEKEASLGSLISVPGVLSGNIPPERKSSDFLNATSGWVYAAVNAIADEVASIKIRLYKVKGVDDFEEVIDHPAVDIIQRANNFTTKFDHFAMTMQYLELTGEAPWFVSYEKGKPVQLLLLRPDCLSVVKGKGDDLISGYTYRVSAKEINLDVKEVVFLRYPDPNRLFRGRGPLQAAARTVDIDDYSEEYNRRFFFNSARPDGVLSTDQKLGREQLNTVERRLQQKFKGMENSHKTLVLEKGLKWEPMGLSQKDMDFLNQSNFSRDKILGIFRVPKNIIGLTENVNRATAEAAQYSFARWCVKPKMERIVQQMNEFLLPLFPGTEKMFYDFDNPVPKDTLGVLEMQKAGLQFGWLTINEARALDGYDAVEGGDELRVPLANVPLDEDVPAELRAFQGRDFSDRVKHSMVRGRTAEKKIYEVKFKKLLSDKLTGEIKKRLLKSRKPKKKEVLDDPKALEFQQKQLNVADDYKEVYEKKVRSVFHAQRDYILNKLPAKSGAKAIDWREFQLLPKKEKERFIAQLSSSVSKLLLDQASEAFNFVESDMSFGANDPVIQRYLEGRAFKFTIPVTKLTNKLLARELQEGIAAGESMADIRSRVRGLFENIENYRAERIARSETIRATNYAAQEAYKESGVVTAKEWLTALDERTCEWCGPMNRRLVGLDDAWFKKGESMTGAQGGVLKMGYETVEHPPLHVNCRCTLIPVVVDVASNGWSASMSEEEAAKWNAESAVTDTLYHGTSEEFARHIEQEGFNVGDSGYSVYGRGIYLTQSSDAARAYARMAVGDPKVLKVKINVRDFKDLVSVDHVNELIRSSMREGERYQDAAQRFWEDISKNFEGFSIDSLPGDPGGTAKQYVITNRQSVTVLRNR